MNVWIRAEGQRLEVVEVLEFASFDSWVLDLVSRPKWTGGFDFPFSLCREFLDSMDWKEDWLGVARKVGSMTKPEFLALVGGFSGARPYGSKEPKRESEKLTGSFAGIKLGRPSMARMTYEGMTRLPLVATRVFPFWGEGERVAVEAYPGVVVRRLVGRRSYKGGTREHMITRGEILSGLPSHFGGELALPPGLADRLVSDESADGLDSIVAALQAWRASQIIWNHTNQPRIEGWIADPDCFSLLVP